MKTSKSTLGAIVVILFIMVIVFSFSSCSKDFFPRAAKDDLIKEELTKPNDLQFLSYGKVLPSLKKTIVVTEFIETDDGGKLKLKYKIDTETGEVKVEIKLKIHKDSIPSDAELSMSIDDKTFFANLDILFGPSGIAFKRPALLDVKIEGIDFSGVDDPSAINIYYDSPNAGWIKMESKKVKVDVNKNKIEIKKAELPHFSRYALCK